MVYPQRFASGSLNSRVATMSRHAAVKLKALEAPKPTLNAFALNSFLRQEPGAGSPPSHRICGGCRSRASQHPRSLGTSDGEKEGRGREQEDQRRQPIQAAATAGARGGAPRGHPAQLTVLAQYIKDLSFESPSVPQSLQGPGQNPQLKVSVNVNAGARGDEAYEVALHLEVHAKSDLGVIYNIELIYAGLFRLSRVPQNLLQPVLFVDCPTILFPFLRRVLADVVRDGGFPPLMLDPMDFGRLYAQNLAPKRGEPAAKN